MNRNYIERVYNIHHRYINLKFDRGIRIDGVLDDDLFMFCGFHYTTVAGNGISVGRLGSRTITYRLHRAIASEYCAQLTKQILY